MKEYPTATHAKTIEYRVSKLDELLELYDQLEKHWRKNPATSKMASWLTKTATPTRAEATQPRRYLIQGRSLASSQALDGAQIKLAGQSRNGLHPLQNFRNP